MTLPSKNKLKIAILTDKDSWIFPWVRLLAQGWLEEGHAVQIAHACSNLQEGDLCFCLSFSQIVPARNRKMFKNTLVVHESNLPEGRGWSPMSWQILEGRNRIAVTLLEAVDEVDSGPIYLQNWIDLEGWELNEHWRRMQAETTLRLCRQFVAQWPDIQGHPQQGSPTYYPRRTPADSGLDPDKTLHEQFNLLRIVDNERYPAFFEMHGRKYRLTITLLDDSELIADEGG